MFEEVWPNSWKSHEFSICCLMSNTKHFSISCNEPPSPTNCHPFLIFRCPTSYQTSSAVCLLWLIFAYIHLSTLKRPELKNNSVFIELRNVNFILLTEWQEEYCKCSRLIDTSITQAVSPVSFICPVTCNFMYKVIYRSVSLPRYCN
jgi:hypothetical protein